MMRSRTLGRNPPISLCLAKMAYEPRATDYFQKDFASLAQLDIKKRISDAVVELTKNPYHNTKGLTGDLAGQRSYRKGDIRILFAICEECRKLNHQNKNACIDCDEIKDKAIKLFTVDYRGRVYE
jgi:mRNA-degrading endonuclease RelE of RelBE toxin-antitoxin system